MMDEDKPIEFAQKMDYTRSDDYSSSAISASRFACQAAFLAATRSRRSTKESF